MVFTEHQVLLAVTSKEDRPWNQCLVLEEVGVAAAFVIKPAMIVDDALD